MYLFKKTIILLYLIIRLLKMKKNLNLKIIYEDESLVVVNKDAGIVTHSTTKI